MARASFGKCLFFKLSARLTAVSALVHMLQNWRYLPTFRVIFICTRNWICDFALATFLSLLTSLERVERYARV
jgi:hypothetical protein